MKYKYLCNKSLLTDLAQSLTWSRRQRVLGAEVRRGADTALHQGPGLGTLHCGITWPQVKWETRSRGPDQRSQMCT